MQNFPDFVELDNRVRAEYEGVISNFPAYSDLSFATAKIWWSHNGEARVARKGDGVVLELSTLEGDKEYCYVGSTNVEHEVEETIAQLALLNSTSELKHVPEVVAVQLDQNIFDVTEEIDYNEYILSTEELTKLEGANHSRTRRKVARFERETESREVQVRGLNFNDADECKNIMTFCEQIIKDNPRNNDIKGDEINALKISIFDANESGIEGLKVLVDGVLYGVVLYQRSHDDSSFIINHIKVKESDDFHHMFDYITHVIARKAFEEGIPYLNFEMDLGIEGLRRHKMGLRPVSFLRKYTVKYK